MSIASDLIRGHTDTIVLSLLSLGDSYGYKINKDIMELTAGRFEFKEATLYTAFRRLEQAGFIASYWGDENSGARRRYYVITEKGKEQYRQNLREWEKARAITEKLLYAANATNAADSSGAPNKGTQKAKNAQFINSAQNAKGTQCEARKDDEK